MLMLATSMQAYFREAMDAALRSSNISMTESAQVYVVHMLNEFSRSERAFAGCEHREKVSMADLLYRAYETDDHEALRIYRHLGDTSLYLLGFFKESKNKGIVSITYYRDIGSFAYGFASDLSRAHAVGSAAIFQELSERFGDMVRVLEIIAGYGRHRGKALI